MLLEKFKKWRREKKEKKEHRKLIDEYDEIVKNSPPLWKYLGFSNQEEMYSQTVSIFGLKGDAFYMATKCPDGSWVVWIDLGGGFCRNHIAFPTWKEAAIFLYEECKKNGVGWCPESFGFREGVDPFENEPDFEYDREVWGD